MFVTRERREDDKKRDSNGVSTERDENVFKVPVVPWEMVVTIMDKLSNVRIIRRTREFVIGNEGI